MSLGAASVAVPVTVERPSGPVVAAALGRWLGLVGGTLAAAFTALVLAGRLAAALPPAVAPLLAAAGALAGVWVLAALIRRTGGADRAPR
jgi:hypothetical protein